MMSNPSIEGIIKKRDRKNEERKRRRHVTLKTVKILKNEIYTQNR